MENIYIEIEAFPKLIDAITNNYDYIHSSFVTKVAYEKGKLSFRSYVGKFLFNIEKFEINEFNKNFILKEFQKINLNKEINVGYYL